MLTDWELKDFDVGADPARVAADRDGWVAVTAPGDTYVALHKAGRLPDPFGDRTEKDCAWVIDREWWWRTSFAASPVAKDEKQILIFHGLDTFAEIFLNGEKLGTSDNMFVAREFDVTGKLHAHNTLSIRFTPPAVMVADKEPLVWTATENTARTKRNLVRKAQFGWGWDWGPKLPTVGIWKPVELHVRRKASLADVKFTTLSIGHDGARVQIGAHVRGHEPSLKVDATLTDPGGREIAARTLTVKDGRASVEFTVTDPQLWWTHDLGQPALYTLDVALREGDAIVDVQEQKVGIRTIALDQSPDPDEPGTTFFRFVLNGVPIFARGACWIPASSFVGALTKEDYRWQIEDAAAGNMNMLRIWGGGIYEHDAFYELCDQFGVLVWQDFMFACARYPEDNAHFIASVDEEVRQQIKRLRNHPSMALWCGNNENQMLQAFQPKFEGLLSGDLYYEKMIPEAVAELDPTTPYWPGSPYGGPHANSMRAGDVHDWTVWHGIPLVPDDRPVGKQDRSPEGIAFTRYAEDVARFVSEYGLHASPALETLRRSLPEDQLTYRSPGMENRIKDNPKDKVNAMLVTVTGLPTDIQEYVDFTQIMQAEGLKFGIEHFRRRMPHCSGSLIWQYNDCWPCVSWSLIDYNGFAKAGYFYVRRAYAPVMASFKTHTGGDTELWITNETRHDLSTEVEIELGTFGGGQLWRERVAVQVPANTSKPVWQADAAKLGPAADRYLHVRALDDSFPGNRVFFAAIKDLARPPPTEPKVEIVRKTEHELSVSITAREYLYFAHLLVPHGATRFSDNYFDLRPGETRVVTVRNGDKALTAADIAVRSC